MITGLMILAVYVAIFAGTFFIVRWLIERRRQMVDFTSLKTVTFGDESAVRPNRAASVISVFTVFLIWGAFTGSKWLPVHVPGPFLGETRFTYTAENAAGERDDAIVAVVVHELGETPDLPVIDDPDEGFAKNDAFRSKIRSGALLKVARNDIGGDEDGYRIVAINGQPIGKGIEVDVAHGKVRLSPSGTPFFEPDPGYQMDPIYLPAPEKVVERFIEISSEGYRNFTLAEHLGWSLYRVLAGFFFGCLIGIPLGYAMGLSDWFRGWFDPIVEFMRPVPPLALIPLVIIWFGIKEQGKIILLFLAALWIMAIAARSGVSNVRISKVHAAYSLGASKWQILRYVIIPNSLPEIFTGARVAMGVCWGTVVAAELVAANVGGGMMIMVASKFQLTDIVLMGIILIGVIGFAIDIFMRMLERWLIPWKGKG